MANEIYISQAQKKLSEMARSEPPVIGLGKTEPRNRKTITNNITIGGMANQKRRRATFFIKKTRTIENKKVKIIAPSQKKMSE